VFEDAINNYEIIDRNHVSAFKPIIVQLWIIGAVGIQYSIKEFNNDFSYCPAQKNLKERHNKILYNLM